MNNDFRTLELGFTGCARSSNIFSFLKIRFIKLHQTELLLNDHLVTSLFYMLFIALASITNSEDCCC